MVAQAERMTAAPAGTGVALEQTRAPLMAALERYQKSIVAPFSAPGHKRGAGAGAPARALLGDGFAADVWLGVADHDPAQQAAEDLAAAAWGAERSFFLVNGSSSGTHAARLSSRPSASQRSRGSTRTPRRAARFRRAGRSESAASR